MTTARSRREKSGRVECPPKGRRRFTSYARVDGAQIRCALDVLVGPGGGGCRKRGEGGLATMAWLGVGGDVMAWWWDGRQTPHPAVTSQIHVAVIQPQSSTQFLTMVDIRCWGGKKEESHNSRWNQSPVPGPISAKVHPERGTCQIQMKKTTSC